MFLIVKLGEDLSDIGQFYILSNKFLGSLVIDPSVPITASSTSAITRVFSPLFTSCITFSLTGVFPETWVCTSRWSSKFSDLWNLDLSKEYA